MNNLYFVKVKKEISVMKKAFTLAEVLITLGIIGIVAALTIPTLIQNYQKRQYVSGFQRGYATIQNALKLAMVSEGVDNLSQTSIWKNISPESSPSAMKGDQSKVVAALSKYLKITKSCHNPTYYSKDLYCDEIAYKDLSGNFNDNYYTKSGRIKIYTPDGLVYYLRLDKQPGATRLGSIEIDINGDKGPNQIGRDLFEIFIDKNNKFMLPGTQEWADISEYNHHWSSESWVACNTGKDNIGQNAGDYCGARVFEQGWRMDY